MARCRVERTGSAEKPLAPAENSPLQARMPSPVLQSDGYAPCSGGGMAVAVPAHPRTQRDHPPLNACELEIDLFCQGMRVPDHVSLAGARGVSRTRAGLGSGLEVVLPTGSPIKDEIWVNVPVVESFARYSPYTLIGGPTRRLRDRGHALRRCLPGPPATRAGLVQPLDVARRADESDRRAPGHVPRDLRQSGLRVLELRSGAQLPLLHDWPERRHRPKSRDKAIEDVVETCRAAQEESGVDVRPPQRRVSRVTRPASSRSPTSRPSRKKSACSSACSSRRSATSAATTA